MKVLWISPFFLHPTDRGGQIRSLGTLRELHKRHEIHFVALNPPANTEGPARSSEYSTRAVAISHQPASRRSIAFLPQLVSSLFHRLPLAVSRYYSDAMARTVRQMQQEEQYDCIVCDFLATAPNMASMQNVVLFQHNVETQIWQRHADEAASFIKKAYFRMQAKKMAAYEASICRAARFVIAVSKNDSERMRKSFGVQRVQSVATGVDLDYFLRPDESAKVADLVFCGSMDWLPNVDAMEFFLHEVMPLIHAARPETTLAIAGRSPDPRVLRAAKDVAGVTVTGSVPDMRPYLWGSSISVVPLRIGGGTRLKIYECMAAGLPIVSTTIGAEGLAYTANQDILIADSPADFAAACLRLLHAQHEATQMAVHARQLVEERFGWETVARDFEDALIANGTVHAI